MQHRRTALVLVCVLLLASLLLLATQLLYASPLTSRFVERFDTFLGMAGFLLVPAASALWRRWTGPAAPRPRADWIAELARAERERIADDLRFRGVDAAPIAVPWRAEPALGDAPPHIAASGEVSGLWSVWSGRLVVVGPAGSGKSISLEILAARLLAEGGPVPVVLSLAGWDPRHRLHSWIGRQVAERHPEVFGEVDEQDLVRALLHDAAVVPFLDGFDEVAENRRVPLLRALRRELGAGLPLVLASRTEQFRAAVSAAGPIPRSVAVRLSPLTPDQFEMFLGDCRSPSLPAWQQLLDTVRRGRAPAVGEAFATPLMQWLGLQVYGHGGADPGELADPSRFPTSRSIGRHLLGTLVPAVFAPPGMPGAARHARRWFAFLARHAERHGDGALRWWELHRSAQPQLAAVYGLLFAALAAGLGRLSRAAGSGLLAGALWGAVCGAAFTGAYVLARRLEYRTRLAAPDGFRSTVSARDTLLRLVRVLPLVAAAAAAATALNGPGILPIGRAGPGDLLTQGLAGSLVIGACGGYFAGVVLNRAFTLDATVAPTNAGGPVDALRRDRRATAAVAVCFTAAGAVVTWTAWYPVPGGGPPAAFALAALPAAAVFGTCMFTLWPVFRAAHAWYVMRGQLPLHYAAFMNRAHDAGLLREDGLVHRFRHMLLQTALRPARDP